jgi:hypothetical protein
MSLPDKVKTSIAEANPAACFHVSKPSYPLQTTDFHLFYTALFK